MPFRLQSSMAPFESSQKNVQAVGIAYPWSLISKVKLNNN